MLAIVAAIVTSTAPFSASGAGAQEAPTGFVRGGASAQADTLGLNIISGGATIGLTVGRSLARYRDRTASSEGRALDLGALEVLFGELSRCDDQEVILPKRSLPPITAADSSDPNAATSRRTQAFFPGLHGTPSTIPAGWQDATATTQPAARAITETPYQDISFFALNGARTETIARLTGELREARAVVEADSLTLMNGMFKFVKPRWEAVSMSGASEVQTGQFTFESAYVFGILRTRDQILADITNFSIGLSNLLSGLGVHIDLPRVEIHERRVTVTPMAFRITDPPMGAAALRPFFDNIQPLWDEMAENMKQQDCNNQVPLQLVDVVLQVLKGSGSATIPVGGVEVTTDDRFYAPAVITPPPPVEAPEVEAPVETTPPPTTAPSFDPAPIGTSPSFVPAEVPPIELEPPPVVEAAVETPEDDGGEDEVAAGVDVPLPPATISSRFEDGTKGGTATVVGILALLTVLALAGADRWAMRRNQRRIE